MAEITHRRSGELVRGVFRLLSAHPEGLPAKIVLEKLVELVPPTDFEKTTYPRRPDTRRYEKIVRFSTIGPVKAGWLVKDKGHWGLTEAGRKAYEAFPDPERFMREASRLYRQWALEQPQKTEAMADEPSPDAATTLEEAEEAAWTEIEEHLETMNPYDFQELVAGLLRGMGYYVAWVSRLGPTKVSTSSHTRIPWESRAPGSRCKSSGAVTRQLSMEYVPCLPSWVKGMWACSSRWGALPATQKMRPGVRKSGASCSLISSASLTSGWSITAKFLRCSVAFLPSDPSTF